MIVVHETHQANQVQVQLSSTKLLLDRKVRELRITLHKDLDALATIVSQGVPGLPRGGAYRFEEVSVATGGRLSEHLHSFSLTELRDIRKVALTRLVAIGCLVAFIATVLRKISQVGLVSR